MLHSVFIAGRFSYTPLEVEVERCTDKCMIDRYNCNLACYEGLRDAYDTCYNSCDKVERVCLKKCD